MKKILLILGVLLTLANNASSGASQPIPPESDNIISSPQKGNNESEVLDSTLGPKTLDEPTVWYLANGKPVDDSIEWYWASGKPVLDSMFDPETREPEWYWANGKPAFDYMVGLITLDDSPEWYWANGKPAFDYMLDPNTLDDSPEWYWANGKPIKAPKDSELLNIMFGRNTLEPEWFWANGKPSTKGPKQSEVLDIIFGRNTLDDSPEWYWANGKPMIPAPKNDEAFIIADHVRHDVKKEIVWAWGKVKIRMENQTIQADKVKIKNKTGEGEARGHVIIKKFDGTKLKAKFSRFNIKSSKGKIFQTRGRLGKKFYIKSSELTRLSAKHYQSKSGSLTTCTGKLPDWLFEAKWMDIIDEDRALFTGGVLKVRNIPILYIPVGYLPLNQERKTGFLTPSTGYNDINGYKFDNAFYWAINDHSDATFKLGYQGMRGFSPEIEYRYTPSLGTSGAFTGKYIKDRLTHETFWKVDATHNQVLPEDWQFNSILDLEGKEYNKTFTDDTNLRNRRISNSFATIRKSWESSSFEILTRYRISVDRNNDQTHGELPQITYKSQRQEIGNSGFYFNQDTLFTSFLTDLNPDPGIDRYFTIQRLDFHPQLTRSINIAPWLNFASTIGLRETIYSKGQNNVGYFTREGLDFNANIKGPTFEKIYHTRNKLTPKIKHLIEPRLSFAYIPELDINGKEKIHPYLPDLISPQSTLSYSLIQRVLQKEKNNAGDFYTREALRFMITQSFDLREAQRVGTANEPSLPFSDIRFDLDSRLVDALLLNIDSNYDYYNDVFTYWNFQVGFRPMDALTFYLERRWNRRATISTVATLDWDFLKGWNLQASTRLDEITDTHRENNLSLLYDDPCKCWAFNIDFIHRNNFNSTASKVGGTKESRWLFSFTFRGLGSVESKARNNERFLHKSFEPLRPSKDYRRKQERRGQRRGQSRIGQSQ
jgi:lipopolysaccharide assembly outer membrane protein LptD (OstA)